MTSVQTLRPDSKGRVTLGKLAQGISGYHVTVEASGRVILEPRVEIPAHEAWLYSNKRALKQLRQGLEDAAQGNIVKRGSFAKYLD